MIKPFDNRWQMQAWLMFLIAAALLLSGMFACAMPFAALAAIAALMLPRAQVISFMLVAWLANQLIGFAFLHYPLDASTFAWGGFIGLAAVAAGALAQFFVSRATSLPAVACYVGALVAAFFGFQSVILIANLIMLGSLDAFPLAEKIDIAAIESAAFGLLLLANALSFKTRLLAPQPQA